MIDMTQLTKVGGYDATQSPWMKSITRPPSTNAGGGTTTTQPTTTTPLTTTPTTPTQTGGTTMPAYDPSSYYPQYGTAQTFNNYPSQWQTASNALTGIAQNGNPANWGPGYEQAKAATQYDITDAIRQAAETAGLGGMRWSTSLGRTAQDIGARAMAGLGAQYAQNQLGAQQQGIQNQINAANPLMALGNMYAQLPMDVANNMFAMGQGMQNAQNQEIAPYYGMWNQTQPYNSPWLQAIMGYSGAFNGSAPQTYNQSFLSQLLGGATSALPFLFL